jgi:hypothetical protein
MDEYDRWYRGYMFRKRMLREAKLIGLGVVVTLVTLSVLAIVAQIARAVA